MFYLAGVFLIAAIIGLNIGIHRMAQEVNKVLPPEIAPFILNRNRTYELIRAHSRYCPESHLQQWIGLILITGVVCMVFALVKALF
jgi:hypothetical protein